jgi:hypothetical protein
MALLDAAREVVDYYWRNGTHDEHAAALLDELRRAVDAADAEALVDVPKCDRPGLLIAAEPCLAVLEDGRCPYHGAVEQVEQRGPLTRHLERRCAS